MAVNSATLSTLYRQYSADVLRFARILSESADEADDIMAETFVRAFTSPAPIRTETVKAYLFVIARNVYREGLRRGRRQVSLDDAPEPLLNQSSDPAEQTEHIAQLDAVARRLASLPPVDRAALVMHVFDGLEYREIARVLDLSLATVKIRIHRARLALADAREGA